MKALRLMVLAFVVFAVAVLPVAAQEKAKGGETGAKAYEGPQSVSFAGPGLGVGIGAALTIVGAGYGFGKIGAAALESMARQPEVAGRVQTGMLIIAALLEGATFFSLIVCILLLGRPGV
jgi:F-type H+-transporting ATPase subunit c